MSVNPGAVTDALGGSDLEPAAIQSFIDAAGRFYDRRTETDTVAPDARDDVVTRLAAHFIATGPERQVDSASESGGSVSFAGETGEGLRATTHGQMAIMLDPADTLGSADKPGASLSSPTVKREGR